MIEPREPEEEHASTPVDPARGPASRARLLDWVYDVVASGSCRQLEDGRFELLCSQAALARNLGLSPTSGGVSKRLSGLERLGILVCRDPVVFDLSGAPRPSSIGLAATTGRDAGSCSSAQDPADPLEVAVALLHGVLSARRTDLLPAALECARALLNQPRPPSGPAHGAVPAPTSAAADGNLSPPLPVASTSSDVSASRSLPSPTTSSTTSPTTSSTPSYLPSYLPSTAPRGSSGTHPDASQRIARFELSPTAPVRAPRGVPSSCFPRQPSTSGGDRHVTAARTDRSRTIADREKASRLRVLAPLLVECARRGLPGVSSPSGLLDAFAGYTLAELERGVEFVLARLSSSVPPHSPVGLLAHLARSGDLALLTELPRFCPTPSPVTTDAPADGLAARLPADEPPGEWLARMASLMRDGDEDPVPREGA